MVFALGKCETKGCLQFTQEGLNGRISLEKLQERSDNTNVTMTTRCTSLEEGKS